MNNYKALKQLIIQQLLSVIQDKIDLATTAIESATDSRNCDTKSSAGDKYETAREMIQIEIEKHKIQLANAQKLKGDLLRIDETISPIRALLGSLIITETELYFLSIGIGKIIVNNQNVFAISIDSPIGKCFYNKQIGENIIFQNKRLVIKELV